MNIHTSTCPFLFIFIFVFLFFPSLFLFLGLVFTVFVPMHRFVVKHLPDGVPEFFLYRGVHFGVSCELKDTFHK